MLWKSIALSLLPAFVVGQGAIFSVPINLGGNPYEVSFLPGQNPTEATSKFVETSGLNIDASVAGQIAQLTVDYINKDPALVDLYNTGMNPPKPEAPVEAKEAPLFVIPVQISGQQLEFAFYDGDNGNSAIARFLLQIGVTNKRDQEALYPDLMGLAEDGIKNFNEGRAKAAAAEAAAPQPMFTVPITVGGVVQEVAHFDGASADAEAQAFCESNGFTVDAVDQLRQCMEVVVGQMQDTYAAMQQAAVTPEPKRALFTLPVTVGGAERTLTFFSGTTPRDSAATFCNENGLATDPALEQYLVALEGAIVGRIDALTAESAAVGAALFEIPVSIDGADQMLVYHENDTPQSRATSFCDEHWGTIKAGLNAGGKRSDIEVAECVTVISDTISNMALKTSQQQAQDRKLILSIPVLVDDQNIPMKLFEGEQPIAVAEAFIAQYSLNPMLVSVLADAMSEELQKL